MTEHDTRRQRLAALPDLPEPVGLAGSTHRTELGGTVCYGLIIATIQANCVQPLGEG